MDDDVYLNDGSAFSPFREPVERKAERNKEKAQVLKEMPYLEKAVKNIAERILATDSVKHALVIAKQYELTDKQALTVLDIVRQQLESEKAILEDLINSYKR